MLQAQPHVPSWWSPFSPAPETWYRWRLNQAEVYLWNRDAEWRWMSVPRPSGRQPPDLVGPETADPPSQDFHTSYAQGRRIALRPCMLDRPLVVEDLSPKTVHRDLEAQFLVDLPVSVRLEAESGAVVGSPNTVLLTKTWFGDTTGGLPCFLWQARQVPPEPPYGSMVRCRIRIRNLSKAPLVLKQFAIYTELLSLWAVDGRLVTNEILLESQSDGSLRMQALAVRGVGPDDLIWGAPVGQADLLIKRGVSFLRSIAGIS